MISRLQHQYLELTEEHVNQLQKPRDRYAVEVRPPQNGSLPATVEPVIRGIMELQSKWLKLGNASPITSFEIHRHEPETLRIQFTAPTQRLQRKIRLQLQNTVPQVRFEQGNLELPISRGDMIGGGLLTTGRGDWFPLETEFDQPPTNMVVSSLHRHAMQDTKFIIQTLFQPVHGQPVRRWYWRRRSYQRRNYLRKEKEKLWGNRSPTRRERKQAAAIDDKAGSQRFHTAIRFLIINAGEYTASRVKELAGSYNIFENTDTGQYLNAVTHTPLRKSHLLNYAQAIASRRFKGWSHSFQTTPRELAGLVSIPDTQQKNIQYAEP